MGSRAWGYAQPRVRDTCFHPRFGGRSRCAAAPVPLILLVSCPYLFWCQQDPNLALAAAHPPPTPWHSWALSQRPNQKRLTQLLQLSSLCPSLPLFCSASPITVPGLEWTLGNGFLVEFIEHISHRPSKPPSSLLVGVGVGWRRTGQGRDFAHPSVSWVAQGRVPLSFRRIPVACSCLELLRHS